MRSGSEKETIYKYCFCSRSPPLTVFVPHPRTLRNAESASWPGVKQCARSLAGSVFRQQILVNSARSPGRNSHRVISAKGEEQTAESVPLLAFISKVFAAEGSLLAASIWPFQWCHHCATGSLSEISIDIAQCARLSGRPLVVAASSRDTGDPHGYNLFTGADS